jgi:hypothetical protein
MTDKKSGEDTMALEKEMALLRARLEQMSRGRRSDFEAALLKGLRTMLAEEGSTAFVHNSYSLLTEKEAEIIVNHFKALTELHTSSLKMRDLYNNMRGALEVMLERLPAIPDPRFK